MTEPDHALRDETDVEQDSGQPWVPDWLKDIDSLPRYQRDLVSVIRDFHLYAVTRGSNTSTFGWERFTSVLEGVQPGLYLIAGAPNHGKSAFLAQMAWQLTNLNDDYYGIWLALDDNANQVIPRFASIITGVPMNAFSMPLRYRDNEQYQEAYLQGLRALVDARDRLLILDQRVGGDIEMIAHMLDERRRELDAEGNQKHFVLFIDSFHDLKTQNRHLMKEEKSRYEFIGEELKKLVTAHEMPIIATAEIRKSGGRRPTLDDIRETGNIAYEANLVLGAYNEVGVKKEAANIYYQAREDGPKLPVLEIEFLKNKLSSYKGRLFYLFAPERSRLVEADEEQSEYFEQRLLM